jgi:hypothetical protein
LAGGSFTRSTPRPPGPRRSEPQESAGDLHGPTGCDTDPDLGRGLVERTMRETGEKFRALAEAPVPAPA